MAWCRRRMCVRSDCSKVRNNLLRALSFTSAGFTATQMSVEMLIENRESTDVIRILWFSRSSPIFTQALSAIANMCGGFSSFRFPRYWCIIASE